MRGHMNCPSCGHNATDGLPFHYEWADQRYDIKRCCACGHISIFPLPSPEQTQSFYGEEYFESGLHGLDREDTTYVARADAAHEQTMEFVKKELLSRHDGARSLFEIGAATGHLLHAARAIGLDEVGGVEISSSAVSHAKQVFDLELTCCNVDEVEFTAFDRGWDIVYAGDVLEHVRDPNKLVTFMKHLVADGGVVITRVPATFELISTRVASRLLSLLGKSLRLPDAPYHIHEFTAHTVRALFQRHFGSVEIDNDIVSPTELNLKGLRPQYLAKLAFHLLNYPVTKLFGICGDRLTVGARHPR